MRILKSLLVISFVFICSCSNEYSPKPYGYLRIDLPEKKYIQYEGNLPYTFEYPVYSIISSDTSRIAEPYWINIDFPNYSGKIHVSYKSIKNNLEKLTEDSRSLAYKHSIKADAINEIIINNKQKKVYGILYEIKGNTASSVQFYITDSTSKFLRAALYFNSQPNKDSLAPIINFFRLDIDRFIQSFEWKNSLTQH